MTLAADCIFCKIIRGAVPSFKVHETPLTYAFLDINPLAEGHIVRATDGAGQATNCACSW